MSYRNRKSILRASGSLVVMLLLAATLSAQELSKIVGKHGLRAVDPPTPASDFTLPNLAGGETSLSDFHGNWVLLTFFATWCGPCRSEMPSMERLHRERQGAGLVVLGVSVDAKREPVGPFINGLGLTFPVLWDRGGKVGVSYRASSIPLSYLVSPEGRIVGVSQGARDWWELQPMFDSVFAAMPPDEQAASAYGESSGPVELASDLEPPTAELSLSDQEPVAGQSFYLEVRLHWGGGGEYLPHAPDVHLPEGVIQERAPTATTNSRDGRNIVTYRIHLRADQPGSYDLDPVELRYTPRNEPEPLISRLIGPTVTVRPSTMLGLQPWLAGVLVGLVVLVAAGTVFFLRRGSARREPGQKANGRDPDYQALQERFDAGRAQRLKGDAAAFILTMADIESELDGSGEPADPALAEAVEGARYGGQVPPSEELERLQRRIERKLEDLRPDPNRKEREAIRLVEEKHSADSADSAESADSNDSNDP